MGSDLPVIAIIGAGLAGLRAAYTLEQLGYSPLLFEAADRVGGRVKTERLNGYTLDYGFQIILTSYSEIFSLFSKKDFEMGYFPSGAMIRHHDEWISVLNPIRDPERLVFGKEPFFFDFLKLSKLYVKQKLQSDQSLAVDPKPQSTWELLKKINLSDSFIEEVLRPFFGGVFFDPELFTSHFAFLRILRFFIEGKACLPKKGIEILPQMLLQKLVKTEVHLQTKIEKIDKKSLVLSNGKSLSVDWTIIATDLKGASSFIPLLSERTTKSVVTLYFTIDEGLFEPAPFLYLNSDPTQPINHFVFVNLIQRSYAPIGKLLLSATVVHPSWQKKTTLQHDAVKQLSLYFNTPENKWEFLQSYFIPSALPDQSRPPLFHGKYCYNKERAIYLCGESVDPSSFQDALASGRRVAETLHAAIIS